MPAPIIGPLWRAVAGNPSAPKRDMSWRGSSTAIISMAQQARPNCIGQIAERRAQLKILS